MCLDNRGIHEAIAALDNGWNTSRRLTRIDWRKARFARGEVAEDILEIAIGPDRRDLEHRIEYVLQRMPSFSLLLKGVGK